MDSKLKRCRSLPPLVDGKVYGYLKLIIDEIVWTKKGPGNVLVLVSWWGENNSLHFKIADTKSKQCTETTEALYVIKTNKTLFQEYIKNCDTLDLVIISEISNEIIGTAQVFNLLDIFKNRPFSRYFPILNPNKIRIGEIQVIIQMLSSPFVSDSKKMLGLKTKKQKKCTKTTEEDISSKIDCLSLNERNKNIYDTILKSSDNQISCVKKSNSEVTDKLVAQVIARAQRLRGIMLKESQDDPLALSDNSFLGNVNLACEKRKGNHLCDFILGENLPKFGDIENNILKPTTSMESLIGLTNKVTEQNLDEYKLLKQTDFQSSVRTEELRKENVTREDTVQVQRKEISSPLKYVDSIRIIIETLTLSSAGYRRVRSSCVSRDERALTATTFFVLYDPVFACMNDFKNKSSKERKVMKIFSRKQYDDVIHFNHNAIYNIPKTSLDTSMPLKFKVQHRHLNQRSPTELGVGALHISDTINTRFLSMTQRVAIINKGIKVAELKVTVELGCDGIHFGKEFIDAVMCEKENIPVIENSPRSSSDDVRYKTITGTRSKQNTAVPTSQPESISSSSVSDSYSTKNDTVRKHVDNMLFKNCSSDNNLKDKVLLHGLIYIAEGKDLPSLDTYLICRAFWREDKAASGVCLNTDKPFYNFHQLVPIIHGQEFLERTKHNYIITEVYSKSRSGDNLIGIAKLPVHQLYVAYRDPLVLPHLTMSKYPIISVDGWVNVTDLVSGQYCGQILALVAVGTADQIALLEMTRGLRNSCVTPRTLQDCADVMSCDQTSQSNYNNQEDHEVVIMSQHCSNKYPVETCRSQECQTEISTVEEAKTRDDCNTSDEVSLHTIVDQFSRVVQHCKSHRDVEMDQGERSNVPMKEKMLKPLHLPPARSNVLLSSDESSIDSPGENLPSAMFRSVGVGAEFNEETIAPQFPIMQQQTSSIEHSDIEEVADTFGGSFKATVEIECAYHLPMVEKVNESVEPSTYVTFQSAMDSVNGRGSNVVTNVCLRTCTPKWDWKCSTRLSRELVNNKDKRLILKIWRLYDPDKNVQVDHEKDIVIGIAAIDLSVFLVGFPVLCGWFNIINYTGEIIGQIRVSITPLENLTNMNNNNFLNSNPTTSYVSSANSEDNDSHAKLNDMMDIMPQFDTESISFLSHSLKQKLTELNEITMRLRTRLHDVTNNAFEDDFDAEFQPIDSDGENESNVNENAKANLFEKNERWSPAQEVPNNVQNSDYGNHQDIASSSKFSFNVDAESNYTRNSNSSSYNNYYLPSSSVNSHNPRTKMDYLTNEVPATNVSSSPSTSAETYPVKGAKVHINHLLDKLSVQLGSHTKPPFPVQGNVMDLLDSLRYGTHELTAKRTNSVPTQTSVNPKTPSTNSGESLPKNTKMSTIIREELVVEDTNYTTDSDELSRHLMISNLRHTGGVENCTNPLFYEHLIPDVTSLTEVGAQSPENDAVKQLDSRYVENFNLTVNNGLQRLHNLPEYRKDQDKHLKSDSINFRITPSGISENIDKNQVDSGQKNELSEKNDNENISSSSTSLDQISVRSVHEYDENALTSSESTTSIVSRQAPDGGNPGEESSGSTAINPDESSSS